MRRLLALITFMLVMVLGTQSISLAHGTLDTADEAADANINIQIYTNYNWGSALDDSMRTWNALYSVYGDGPRMTLVTDKSKAEVVVEPNSNLTKCGNYFYVSPNVGPDIMQIKPSCNNRSKYMLHEEGHTLGLYDHFDCDGILSIMSYCYFDQVNGLTNHDKNYYEKL
jgi:hypothetical protein